MLQTLRRWSAAPTVVLLAWLAYQDFSEPESTIFGWLAFALIALITALSIPALPFIHDQNAGGAPSQQIFAKRIERRLFSVVLLIAGVYMLVSSIENFWTVEISGVPRSVTWSQYIYGIVALLAGLVLLFRGQGIRWQWRSGLLLLFVVIVALGFRFYNFAEQPPGLWYDEAINGLEARRMLEDDSYRPIFIANMTALHLWLYMLALDWFGEDSVQALRLTSVLFGVGAVGMAFIVGQSLRGPWFGLLMGFFMAIMRWSVNFSRIAMTGIEVGFFTLLVFYFLLRFKREGRWRDALWAGIAAGVGLWFYSAFRLLLIALALYGLLSIRFWRPRRLLPLLLAACVALAIISPVLIYAVQHDDVFFSRTRDVSILEAESRTSPALSAALENNIRAHLQMFHVSGDFNGRHNIPLEPMLDPIMGVLLVMGLALSLRNGHHTEEWFFILVMVFSLLSGILTLEFEAPQSLRTIGVLPAVAYFCALAARGIAHWGYQRLRPLLKTRSPGQVWAFSGAGVMVILALSLVWNAHTYFERQRENFKVWESFSSVEVLIGREFSDQPDDALIYLSPLLLNEPSARFVAPDMQARQQALEMPGAFPLVQENPVPVAIFLHHTDKWLYEEARRIYPAGDFQEVRAEDYGIVPLFDRPLFYVIELSAEDIRSTQGLDETGSGVLMAPVQGRYYFEVPPNATLTIDDYIFEPGISPFYLSRGSHRITINPSDASVSWQIPPYPDVPLLEDAMQPIPDWYLYHTPVVAYGLPGCFYTGGNWEGTPILQRVDPVLDMYFHLPPLKRPYSVYWAGLLNVPKAGEYRFILNAVEHAELWINGEMVVYTESPGENFQTAPLFLSGSNTFEVFFADTTSYSQLYVRWLPPGGDAFVTIPPEKFAAPARVDDASERLTELRCLHAR